jgi:hypothetical protein
MLVRLVIRTMPFLALSAAATTACVWTNGNLEIAPPRVEDGVFSAPPPTGRISWSARIAPTAEEISLLASLRAAARTHRLESPAFREAERAACADLSDDDRDVSPFFYRDEIVDVQPLRAPGGSELGPLEGTVVTFRRVEGLTVGRLQRLMDCQVARDAALDDSAPETTWCPLAVPGVLADVLPSHRGLDVRLASAAPGGAEKAYLRAVALRPAR